MTELRARIVRCACSKLVTVDRVNIAGRCVCGTENLHKVVTVRLPGHRARVGDRVRLAYRRNWSLRRRVGDELGVVTEVTPDPDMWDVHAKFPSERNICGLNFDDFEVIR